MRVARSLHRRKRLERGKNFSAAETCLSCFSVLAACTEPVSESLNASLGFFEARRYMSKLIQNSHVLASGALAAGDLLTPKELATRLKVPLSWVYKQ
jgi:hypothetical protein